jgi:phospholipid-binding lipoprotein MlaA
MKLSSRTLGIFLVFSLFNLLVLPVLNAQRAVMGHLSSVGVAWAAGEESYLKEPFAVQPQNVPDPLEKFNRAMFTFNDRLYFWFLKPVALVYKTFLPPGVRTCFRNAFSNAAAPVRIVNNLLQGRFDSTGIELSRFVINTTLGFAGFFDFANTQYGLQQQYEDFGLTLGHFGMKPVMYINWPILGPSDVRDMIGTGVDVFMVPYYYFTTIPVGVGVRAGETVNNTSLRIGEYEDFKKAALDPYVSMRDAYLQYRAKQLQK